MTFIRSCRLLLLPKFKSYFGSGRKAQNPAGVQPGTPDPWPPLHPGRETWRHRNRFGNHDAESRSSRCRVWSILVWHLADKINTFFYTFKASDYKSYNTCSPSVFWKPLVSIETQFMSFFNRIKIKCYFRKCIFRHGISDFQKNWQILLRVLVHMA